MASMFTVTIMEAYIYLSQQARCLFKYGMKNIPTLVEEQTATATVTETLSTLSFKYENGIRYSKQCTSYKSTFSPSLSFVLSQNLHHKTSYIDHPSHILHP